jgi:site-specific recombinase XerD
MITDYIKAPKTVAKLRGVRGGEYFDDFTEHLASKAFVPPTICKILHGTYVFLRWAEAAHVRVDALDEVAVQKHRRHLQAIGRPWRYGPNGIYGRVLSLVGGEHFIRFLVGRGIAKRAEMKDHPLLDEFSRWMQDQRGAKPSTVENCLRVVLRSMMLALGEPPMRYDAHHLRAFLTMHARRYSRGSVGTIVSAVRVFLRFLVATERCPPGIDAALPKVARWRLASVPQHVDPADVEAILTVCDLSTRMGIRNYAILLLLARLGLRPDDAHGLNLADLDWQRARIRVAGKNRREEWLPLTQEVGDAIRRYIESARPPSSVPQVFLTMRAPRRPLGRVGVGKVAARAIKQSGIKAPRRNAYLLRHSAAVGMLKRGLTLNQIGAILRHKSISTTAQYAKVDDDLLRGIALPWPETRS